MPLIFGSLKVTAYALLFAIPVALLAAVFSAAFLPADVKRIVKPTMEIMSSLPSVVLGFLAGLWLAPILSDRVPSVMMLVILVPLSALLVGYVWCRMPLAFRNRFEGGNEWMIVIPFLALAAMGAALTGYALDAWRLDLLALGVVWALGSLAVWLDGPAPAWVVRLDAWIGRWRGGGR